MSKHHGKGVGRKDHVSNIVEPPPSESKQHYEPRFAHLQEKPGLLGEQATTCALILSKLYDIPSKRVYALAEFFYAVTYETKLKNANPDAFKKEVMAKYSHLGSEEEIKAFLHAVEKETHIVMMPDEHQAISICHELVDNMDTLADIAGETGLAFTFIGTNYYSWRNQVPSEYKDAYERAKSVFYTYHRNDNPVFVGTMPKDYVTYKQKEERARERMWTPGEQPSNGRFMFWIIMAIGIIIIGSFVISVEPHNDFGLRKMIFPPKNCTPLLNDSMCAPQKPTYCQDGILTNQSSKCGCDEGFRPYMENCILLVNCTDGTLEPDCSKTQPMQCFNGTLVEKASVCGCPADNRVVNDSCVKIQRCADQTLYGECSKNQPLFCLNGSLVERASVCGCPPGLAIEFVDNKNTDRCVVLSDPATPSNYVKPAEITPSNVNIAAIEERVHNLINAQRTSNGLAALSYDGSLATIARKHSADMGARNFFSHSTPEGLDPTSRGSLVGYNCYKDFGSYYKTGIAENIFQTWTYGTIYYINGIETSREHLTQEQISQQVVNGWMDSPGHRENILTASYDREGIGVSITSEGKVLVTEDFC